MRPQYKDIPLQELERLYDEKKAWLSARLDQYETASGPDWDELFELRREIDRRLDNRPPVVDVNFSELYTTD